LASSQKSKTHNAKKHPAPVRQHQHVTRAPLPQQKGPVRKGPTMRKKDHSQFFMVLGVLALIAVIIGAFVLINHWQNAAQANSPASKGQAVDSTVLQELTGISPSTWEAINTGNVTQPFTDINGSSTLKGPNGLPEVLYIGGDYCPNCAAQRWAMINALSRFGTFSNLSQIQSYEGSISTFSFEGSSYSSQYVDFVGRETQGNTVDSSGNYVALDTLTTSEQQIFQQDDSGGSIPFIDIGNSYKAIGASFQYSVLQDSGGNSRSWEDIASSLGDTSSPLAQNILGTANYLTAAICSIDNQQPGSVCGTSVIQTLEKSLGVTAAASGTMPSPTVAPAAFFERQRRLA